MNQARRFQKYNLKRTNQGITMIALVVTIVVLLIIAGITIGSLTGDNSVIKNTKDSKDSVEIINAKQRVEMAYIYSQSFGDKNSDNVDMGIVLNQLRKDGYTIKEGKATSDQIYGISVNPKDIEVVANSDKTVDVNILKNIYGNKVYYILIKDLYYKLLPSINSIELDDKATPLSEIEENEPDEIEEYTKYSISVESSNDGNIIANYDEANQKIIVTGINETTNPEKITVKYSDDKGREFTKELSVQVIRESLKVYSIEYELGGGTLELSNPSEYTEESNEIKLKNPIKYGYVFKGWVGTGLNKVTQEVIIPTGSTGNRRYSAIWEANEDTPYKVKHWKEKINVDGTEENSTNYQLAETETLKGVADTNVTPEVKTYEGFTSPRKQIVQITPDGSRVVNYYYTRNNYKVTYNYLENGGTTATTEEATVDYEEDIDLSVTATKANWDFVGWNINEEAKEKLDNKKMEASDITLYAIYSKEVTIKATFDKNEGNEDTVSGEVNATIYNKENTATVKVKAPEATTRIGYNFIGYSTNKNATTKEKDAGDEVEITTDIADTETTKTVESGYFHIWTEGQANYTVQHFVMDTNGEYPSTPTSEETKTATTNSAIIADVLKKETAEYNVTNGIYYDHAEVDNDTTPVTRTTVAADGSRIVKLYYARTYGTLTTAKGANVRTITEQNGQRYYYGAEVSSLTATPEEETGYQIEVTGWTSDKQSILANKNNPTGTFTWPAMENGTEITLTANANKTANTYTVTYNYNGANGGNTEANKTVTYNATYETLPTPTKTYEVTLELNGGTGDTSVTQTETFAGWYKEAGFTNQVSSNTTVSTAQNHTIYAKWTSGSITLPTPTREGYTFQGWYEDSGFATKYGNAGETKVLDGTKSRLYAQWTVNQYSVSCEDWFVDASNNRRVHIATQPSRMYNYGSTANGSDWGTGDNGYYRYHSSVSATVGTGGATVYRYYYVWNDVNIISPYGSQDMQSAYFSLSNDGVNWDTGLVNESAKTNNLPYGTTIYIKDLSPYYSYYEYDNCSGCTYSNGQWTYTVTGPNDMTIYMRLKSYALDLNGVLDGSWTGSIGGYGTADVYINGTLVADDVSDFCSAYPIGTNYTITDIKTASGKQYNGVASGSLTGSIAEQGTTVWLNYSTLSMAQIIASNKEYYYGKRVTNYTAGGGTYRIFYVDTAGTFGEPNTIYLKRDWDTDYLTVINNWGPSDYTAADKTVMQKMNSMWYAKRGEQSEWELEERVAMWLSAPSGNGYSTQFWSRYYDSSKANYVIGSPSVEIYCASYNDVEHTMAGYYRYDPIVWDHTNRVCNITGWWGWPRLVECVYNGLHFSLS